MTLVSPFALCVGVCKQVASERNEKKKCSVCRKDVKTKSMCEGERDKSSQVSSGCVRLLCSSDDLMQMLLSCSLFCLMMFVLLVGWLLVSW